MTLFYKRFNFQLFAGNTDTNTVVANYFPEPIPARVFRIHPISWNDIPVMRFELLLC